MRPCNALSIAEACGLPRETVRRKVVMLTERGYIYRSEEGFLFLTGTVGDDFEDMTAGLVEALLATAGRLQSLLSNQPTPLGPLRLDRAEGQIAGASPTRSRQTGPNPDWVHRHRGARPGRGRLH